jgi:two-component system, OmpR family, sensor histidine kinase BaeS
MKLRLSHQLFLMLAVVSIVAIAASAWLHVRALERGFINYLNALESDRLDALAPAIERTIRAKGLDTAAREWRRLLGQASRRTGGAALEHWLSPAADEAIERPARSRKATPDPLRFNPRVSLVSADGRLLAGAPLFASAGATTREIAINGETVARLVLAPLGNPTEDRELTFLREQRTSIAWMAFLVTVLCIALTAFLAGWWSRRLLAVTTSTDRIAQGDLTARVTIRGQDEISTLAANVNAMAHSLELMESSRRKWLADVAHELRTPLTTLRGEIEAMQDGVRPLDAAALASLHDDVSRLTRLTGDLHQLAIADVGALEIHRTTNDLSELIKRAAGRWQSRFDAARITFSIDVPAAHLALVDADRITQVLDNLFANSLRYTDSPGHLMVSIRTVAGQHQIVFADSPPGLTDDALGHLFTPFYRANPSRRTGGSGLGLALSKAIIEAHHGSMRASRSALGGLQIIIELPPQ